jgi:hypothetical protein
MQFPHGKERKVQPSTYTNFITTAKKYANQGESQRLSLMMLLLDTEPRNSLWQGNPNQVISWDGLLREEGLCTPGLYHDFKRATSVMKVEVFGVYASAALVKIKAQYRPRIIKATQQWIDSHRVPPTYQRINKYVRDLKKDLGIRAKPSTPIHALRSENNRLKRELNSAHRYIETLQATLKKNNIRIPREN